MKSFCSFTTQAKPKILTNIARFTPGFFTFLLTIALVVHLTCLHAWPAQVTLAWDPIAQPNVQGYKLYLGPTSGNYTQSINVGTGSYDGTAVSYTVPDIPVGQYYFAVTFYDFYGNESEYSNEVSGDIPVVQQYTLTVNGVGTGGCIFPAGATTVNSGASQTYTIIPDTRYRIDDVVVDGVSVGAVSSYTFNSIIANHTISATFAVMNYIVSLPITTVPNSTGIITANSPISAINAATTDAISATTGTGGSVSPAGATTVNSGAGLTNTNTPAGGYRVAEVTTDGRSAAVVTTDTVNNGAANHSFMTGLTVNDYSVPDSAGRGVNKNEAGTGAVTGPGINCGTDCSGTFDTGTGETLSAAPADTAASARVFTITTTSDNGGAIIPSGNPPVNQAYNESSVIKMVTVNEGASQAFTITPNAGYHLVDVKADGTSVGVVGVYTFNNVTAGHSLVATFAINSYYITSSAGTGDSVFPAGATTVDSGASRSYNITQ